MLFPLPSYSQTWDYQWLRGTQPLDHVTRDLLSLSIALGTLVAGVCKTQWRDTLEDHTQIQLGQQRQPGFGFESTSQPVVAFAGAGRTDHPI